MQNRFWPEAAKLTDFTLNVRAHSVGDAGKGGHYNYERKPGEQWAGQVQIAAMVTPDALRFRAFLHALRGKGGTFLMPLPNRKTPIAGTITADVAADADTLPLSAALAAVQAGDWIVLGDVQGTGQLLRVTGRSGNNATVRPRVRVAQTSGTAVAAGLVYGRFRLDQETPIVPLVNGRSTELTVKLAEAYSLQATTYGYLLTIMGV